MNYQKQDRFDTLIDITFIVILITSLVLFLLGL
jgi:hypothetical protein